MKKLLALVLALVMTLSLCTISNAAYSDAKDIDYKEAVDVMSAIGVLEGTDGKFNPDGILTREQAAKIVTYMLLGKKAADALVTIAAPFADVAADRWSAGSIAYCYNEGILAGVGNGQFAPTAQLTGLAFAKMMLTALGYDAEVEGLTGSQWSINAAKLALTVGLTDDMDDVSLSAPMTREQAAQMAFNTELATMVQYDNNSTITAGNVTIKTQSAAKPVETDSLKADLACGDNDVVEFAEKYATKLAYVEDDSDDFGRPGHGWTYDNKSVGTYTDKADVVFTAATSLDNVTKAIKGLKFAKSETASVKVVDKTTPLDTSANHIVGDLTITANHAIAADVEEQTGNGKLVEIYADKNNLVYDVVVVTYTLAEVTKVTEKNGDVSYTLKNVGNSATGTVKTYADEDKDDEIVIAGTIAKGDYVTYTMESGTCYVYPTTSVSGKQTKYYTEDNSTNVKSIVVDGTSYTRGSGVIGCAGLKGNSEGVFYLDQYGYAVYTTASDASTDYAFIIDAFGKATNGIGGYTYTVQVKAVLADGTVGTYDVALKKESGSYYIKNVDDTALSSSNAGDRANLLDNNVYGYTLSDKTITLEPLTEATGTMTAETTVWFRNNAMGHGDEFEITKNTTSFTAHGASGKTIVLPKATTIVVYDNDAETAKVYPGVASLGTTVLNGLGTANNAVVFRGVAEADSANVATANIVFALVNGGVIKTAENYAYVDHLKYDKDDSGSKTNYIYTAKLVDGTTVELHSNNDALDATGLYKYDEDGFVKDAYLLRGESVGVSGLYGYGQVTVSGDMLQLNGVYYDMSEAEVLYVNSDYDEVDNNTCFFVLAEDNGTATKNVEAIFVVAD